MTLQKPPMPLTNAGFSTFTQRRKRWDDGIPWLEFPDGKWLNLRFFGESSRIVHMVATHWLTTIKNKKRFPMLCLNYNSETRSYDKEGCPICEDMDPFNSEHEVIKQCSPRLSGYSHVIVRSIQKAGAISPDWKPWRPIRIPISVMISLEKLKDRNTHVIEGVEYAADIADPYYGRDVSILYDSQGANPQSKYSLDKGDHTPLTEEEQIYIAEIYNFGALIEYPDRAELKKALTQNGYYQMLNTGTIAPEPAEAPPAPVQSFTQKAPPPPATKPAPKPIATGGMNLGQAGLSEPSAVLTPQPVGDEIPFKPGNTPIAPVAHGNAAVKVEESSDLQQAIETYSLNVTRATPLKACDKGPLANLNVLACFGQYKGDMHCVRCPIRKPCLQA